MTENDEALKEAGLKVTHPRVRILELFQSDPKTHYSAEEVHNYLIKNKNFLNQLIVMYSHQNQFLLIEVHNVLDYLFQYMYSLILC